MTIFHILRTVFFLALACVLGCQGQVTDAGTPNPPGNLVDVGGRKLHLYCTGKGSPIVILESGAGSFAIDWALVQLEVAKTTRVCSYDRAGHGWSDPGRRKTRSSKPRTTWKLR